ncbi:MAG: hypothetical protein ACLU38_03930 [Dysosmobacter sp.]
MREADRHSRRRWTSSTRCPTTTLSSSLNKKSKTNAEVSQAMLEAAIPALEAMSDWTTDAHPRHPHRSG